jgi:hypothetical protein
VQDTWKAYNGQLVADTREEHLTNPVTQWFLVKDRGTGEVLKIAAVIDDDGIAYLKTACHLDSERKKK